VYLIACGKLPQRFDPRVVVAVRFCDLRQLRQHKRPPRAVNSRRQPHLPKCALVVRGIIIRRVLAGLRLGQQIAHLGGIAGLDARQVPFRPK
jgi:hypothetical protein